MATILQRVIKVIKSDPCNKKGKTAQITRESRLTDLFEDQTCLIMFILGVEREFSNLEVEINEEEVGDFETIEDVVKYLRDKRAPRTRKTERR